MDCPRCRLINPDGALRCDCGYDFATGEMKGSYLRNAQNQKGEAQFQELVEKHGGVDAAFKVIGKRSMLQGAAACGIGLLATVISFGLGRYAVVFTGVVLIGAVQFFRGLTQYMRKQ